MAGKKFALVRWIEDEKVGVVPFADIAGKERAYPGDVKWGSRKKHEAENLKISGESSFILVR